jgi:hypothetical protein
MRNALEQLKGREPIIGWRGWRLAANDDGGLDLVSAVRSGEAWPKQTAAAARCVMEGHDRAPEPDGNCGLYAFKSASALRALWGTTTVVGTVALWGRVVEHQWGYRAEFAYPQRIRLVCVDCFREGAPLSGECFVVVDAPDEQAILGSAELVSRCWSHSWEMGLEAASAASTERLLLSEYRLDLLPDIDLPAVPPRHPFADRRRLRVPRAWRRRK